MATSSVQTPRLILPESAFPVMHTPRLTLRAPRAEDAAALFYLRAHPEVMQYLDRPAMTSETEALQLLELMQRNYDQQEGITWIITQREQETAMIGHVGLWRLMKEHFRAEIGYMLHPGFQKQGLMREALCAILPYGFETIGLHSIEANVNPANRASIQLLERCGFRQEAYFRENYYYNGRFLDSAIFSLIDREFVPCQSN